MNFQLKHPWMDLFSLAPPPDIEGSQSKNIEDSRRTSSMVLLSRHLQEHCEECHSVSRGSGGTCAYPHIRHHHSVPPERCVSSRRIRTPGRGKKESWTPWHQMGDVFSTAALKVVSLCKDSAPLLSKCCQLFLRMVRQWIFNGLLRIYTLYHT